MVGVNYFSMDAQVLAVILKQCFLLRTLAWLLLRSCTNAFEPPSTSASDNIANTYGIPTLDQHQVGERSSSVPGSAVHSKPDCGLFAPSGRIVGGDLVQKKDQVPWAVHLSLPYIYNATHNSSKSCGGSIISAHFVLTASHCISLEGINLHEANIFYNSTEKQGGPTVGIAALIRHPLFIPGAFAHDIALAKTTEPISFDRFVRPVCLPRKRSRLAGKKAVVSGWGRVSAGGFMDSRFDHVSPLQAYTFSSYSVVFGVEVIGDRDNKISLGLLQATQTILPFKRCRKSLSEADPHRTLTWRVALCAREKGKGICMGDSGGPLTIITEGHKAVQVGVVSFAFGCAHPTNADFYTRVSTYVPWIKEQLAASDN